MPDTTETILTWNVTNWITVVIMAAVGFAIVATVYKFATRNQEAA